MNLRKRDGHCAMAAGRARCAAHIVFCNSLTSTSCKLHFIFQIYSDSIHRTIQLFCVLHTRMCDFRAWCPRLGCIRGCPCVSVTSNEASKRLNFPGLFSCHCSATALGSARAVALRLIAGTDRQDSWLPEAGVTTSKCSIRPAWIFPTGGSRMALRGFQECLATTLQLHVLCPL